MTPVPTTTPIPPSEPTTEDDGGDEGQDDPADRARGAGAAGPTRSAARAARVRGASRIGRRLRGSRRAEPVTVSASDPAGLHHRVEEAQVLDLADGPAVAGGPEAVDEGNEVARLTLGPAAGLEMPDHRSCAGRRTVVLGIAVGLQVPPIVGGTRAYEATCFARALWPAVAGLQSADMAPTVAARAMRGAARCAVRRP